MYLQDIFNFNMVKPGEIQMFNTRITSRFCSRDDTRKSKSSINHPLIFLKVSPGSTLGTLLSNHAAVSLAITANPKSQHDTAQMLTHKKQTCCLTL